MAHFITGCFSIDCLNSVLPHVGYILDIKKKAMELETEGDQLKRFREDLQSRVHRATADGIMVLNNEQQVKGWLDDDAKKAIHAAEKYVTQAREMMGNHSFLSRWTVKVWDCYQLRNHIAETTESVVRIKNSKPVVATIPRPPEPVLPYPATPIKKDSSADRTMEKVRSCLLSNEHRKIGVYGMGGIGKTTIIKNIIKKLEGTNHFDHVICVVVSRDWNNNMSKLRNDIAKEIHSPLNEESQDRASRLLYNKLKDKKFLLVLDDVWEKIDLEELGVPGPFENNGSKVALTTRQKGICHEMETDIEVMVEPLSEDESWVLFGEKAGGSIPSSVEDVARLVCKECCGLPLAIITVGSAMRKQDQMTKWNRALRCLEDELNYNIRGTKDEDVVYTHLRFSYDMLSNDTLRSCFLYASLFPEDCAIKIEELIEYWVMEGYVGRGKNQKDAFEDGHHCLIELVDSCLLLQENEYNVKMHDVIRDMTIKITSESTKKGKRFWAKAGVLQQEEFGVEIEELKTKDKISLMYNSKFKWLRGNPNIPETSTLLLGYNFELCKIDEGFFRFMTSLSILDLSLAGIECLPGSLCKLVSLKALILRYCEKLKSIDPVVGLVNLRFLNLSGSGIVELPQDMGRLIQLVVLDISYTLRLKNIPSGIIARLSRLEILDTIGCGYFFQPHSTPSLKVVIEELKNLKCLSFLSFHFRDIETFDMLGTVCNWKNLRGFFLDIGMGIGGVGVYHRLTFRRERKWVSISNVMDFLMNDDDGFIKHTNTLVIKSDPRLRTISQLGMKNLVNIKECIVSRCNDLEYFITSHEAENTFPWLEILNLECLPKLRTIWFGHVTIGSFERIRIIQLLQCDQLTHLFSTDMICQLHCLEEMDVTYCGNLETIIQGDGHGSHVLPKLREIRLKILYKLTKLWEGDLSLPSLKYLQVEGCYSLRLPQVAPDVQVNIVE